MIKFFFTFDKIDGRIISYSKGKNEVENKFLQLELDITPEEYEKLQQNYLSKIINGKLILEPSSYSLSEEKQKKVTKAKKELIEKGDKITAKELKDLLLQII